MSTHDYNIANQTALNFRGDLNDALEAIVSTNSNATAPTTTYAHMFWYDTTNDLLKMRDKSNSAWITLGYVDQSNLNFQPYIGGTQVTEVLDEDDLVSDSATAIPSQQSVKAYVDALDTTVDGIDVKNRMMGVYTKSAGDWQTFTSPTGIAGVSLDGYTTSSGASPRLYIAFSTNGGSSWSSDIELGAVSSASNLGIFRAVIDLESGNYIVTAASDGGSVQRSSGTFTARTSSTNAFRLRVINESVVYSAIIEQGFSS